MSAFLRDHPVEELGGDEGERFHAAHSADKAFSADSGVGAALRRYQAIGGALRKRGRDREKSEVADAGCSGASAANRGGECNEDWRRIA